jgi:hypothetical protein
VLGADGVQRPHVLLHPLLLKAALSPRLFVSEFCRTADGFVGRNGRNKKYSALTCIRCCTLTSPSAAMESSLTSSFISASVRVTTSASTTLPPLATTVSSADTCNSTATHRDTTGSITRK